MSCLQEILPFFYPLLRANFVLSIKLKEYEKVRRVNQSVRMGKQA